MKPKHLLIILACIILYTSCKKSVIPKPLEPITRGDKGDTVIQQKPVDRDKLFGSWKSVSIYPDYPVRYFGKDGLYYEKVFDGYHFGDFYWGSSDSLTFRYTPSNEKFTVKVLKLNSDSLVFVTTMPYIYRYAIQSRTMESAASGSIETIVNSQGMFGFNGEGVSARSTWLSYPLGITTNKSGDIFYVDLGNYKIRRINQSDSTVHTICGSYGSSNWGLDNTVALETSIDGDAKSLSMDDEGNLYFVQSPNTNSLSAIYRLSVKDGRLYKVIGTGAGYSGDGGLAKDAQANHISDVKADKYGNIFFGDQFGKRIRKITASTGIITTIAGNGKDESSGDGAKAIDASVQAYSLALDSQGNLYFASENIVRKLNVATGTITTIAGNGQKKVSGDGVDALKASFARISSLLVAPNGDVFIGESGEGSGLIRKINSATNIITRIAGDGQEAYNGDGKYPRLHSVNCLAMAFDNKGDIIISDFKNRIRKLKLY